MRGRTELLELVSRLVDMLDRILFNKGGSIMATLEQLVAATEAQQAAIAALAASITTETEQVRAAIELLKNTAGIDPAALDPVLASMDNITAAVTAASQAVQAVYEPDAAPAE